MRPAGARAWVRAVRRHVLPEAALASSRLSAPGGRAAARHRGLGGLPGAYTTLLERPAMWSHGRGAHGARPPWEVANRSYGPGGFWGGLPPAGSAGTCSTIRCSRTAGPPPAWPDPHCASRPPHTRHAIAGRKRPELPALPRAGRDSWPSARTGHGDSLGASGVSAASASAPWTATPPTNRVCHRECDHRDRQRRQVYGDYGSGRLRQRAARPSSAVLPGVAPGEHGEELEPHEHRRGGREHARDAEEGEQQPRAEEAIEGRCRHQLHT